MPATFAPPMRAPDARPRFGPQPPVGPHGTPILDRFNRADQGPPLPYPWGAHDDFPGFSIVNGRCVTVPHGAGQSWSQKFDTPAEVFFSLPDGLATDYSIYVDLLQNVQGNFCGPGYFEMEVTRGHVNLYELDIESCGALDNVYINGPYGPMGVGGSLGFSFDGTTVAAWYKPAGGEWEQIASHVGFPSAPTSGYIGVWVRNDGTKLDDFGGGSF